MKDVVWGYDKLAEEAWDFDPPDLVYQDSKGVVWGYDKLAQEGWDFELLDLV